MARMGHLLKLHLVIGKNREVRGRRKMTPCDIAIPRKGRQKKRHRKYGRNRSPLVPRQ